tara:strand:+ start:1857 stop:2369 length:513 start_codon:yes stop_codon:yes gene_type:complete
MGKGGNIGFGMRRLGMFKNQYVMTQDKKNTLKFVKNALSGKNNSVNYINTFRQLLRKDDTYAKSARNVLIKLARRFPGVNFNQTSLTFNGNLNQITNLKNTDEKRLAGLLTNIGFFTAVPKQYNIPKPNKNTNNSGNRNSSVNKSNRPILTLNNAQRMTGRNAFGRNINY